MADKPKMQMVRIASGEKLEIPGQWVENAGMYLMRHGLHSMQAIATAGLLAAELHKMTYLGGKADPPPKEDFLSIMGDFYEQARGDLFRMDAPGGLKT